MTIFNVVGTNVVGKVLRRGVDGYALEWAAQLSFTPVPLEGGQRFKVEAHLTPFTPCLPGFVLAHAGIRGYAVETRPWLKELYQRFVARAEAGEFDMNPYAPPEKMDLQQGDGSNEDETAHVSTVSALPAPADTTPGNVDA
jgi:hypothetical protein